MSNAFNALGVTPELAAVLQHNGISEPTPVQRQTIPLLLKDQDVIAQAQTGTGKTLAFALPMLQRVNTDKEQVQALILTPTRELAIQITAELRKLAATVGATVLAAYGGQDVDAQIRKLQRAPHIVVATPGRLIDHMTRGTISLGKLSMLVLDEADQMLHMGFLPEVESIIVQTPKARQTMLFSATMPEAIRRLAVEYMKSPADVTIRSVSVTLDSIRQLVVDTTDRGKQQALIQLLEQHQPYLAVVFCRTKVRAKKLNEALLDHGFQSDELHGDLTQAKREQVMKRFREARLQILVATDVAARGLDVEGVTHVYNYDMPLDAESYIHRIGRTGRAGQSGMAVTLATPYDSAKLAAIEKGIQARLDHRSIDRDGELVSGGGARRGNDAAARGSKAAGSQTSRGAGRRGGERGAAGSTQTGRRGGAQGAADSTQAGRRGGAQDAADSTQAGRRGGAQGAADSTQAGRRGGAQGAADSTQAGRRGGAQGAADSTQAGRRGGTRGAVSGAGTAGRRGKLAVPAPGRNNARSGGRSGGTRGADSQEATAGGSGNPWEDKRDSRSPRSTGRSGGGHSSGRGPLRESKHGSAPDSRGGREAGGRARTAGKLNGQSKPGGRGASRSGGRGRR